MISNEIIEEVKNRLVKTYNPVAIYLFGSYAWGSPTEDSDLDLLIVVDKSNERSFDRPRPGQRALFGLGISKDMIVYTKDEFEKYADNITTLCHKIKKDGKVLYARS
ncbi:MAG: polymerase, beta domain protein region protein [candidate division TM6 bacterium GW2011_GWF2_37_49]|nr:MAG: polymerase, beta domain protein region protein [candidate division TM6 bacterium GW2011_GWF2_37_49]